MKTVLVVSYFFPPFSNGSTVRVHHFVKYLPEFGVQPVVLTAREDYYPGDFTNDALMDSYADCVDVVRTKSLEPKAGSFRAKVYGVKKRTSFDKILIALVKRLVNVFLIPDRNVLWAPYAVRAGLRELREKGGEAILATGPPFTAHLVAYLIARRTNLPLILDVRDDWIGNAYYDSGNAVRRWIERRLERRIVEKAAHVVCATRESVELFWTKYPGMARQKFSHISNGFESAHFEGLAPTANRDSVEFIHMGSLPPTRPPKFFLKALRRFLDTQPEFSSKVRVRFIGYVPLEYQAMVEELDLVEQVDFVPYVPPEEVARILVEEAGVCLIFQRQMGGGLTAIPGKLYEYIAARKPILCMTDGGSTSNLLRELGVDLITGYDDVEAIESAIEKLVLHYDEVAASFDWPEHTVNRFSRREHTKQLSALLMNTSSLDS